MKLAALSVQHLLKQNSCCGCGCKNCPYLSDSGDKHIRGSVRVDQRFIEEIIERRRAGQPR